MKCPNCMGRNVEMEPIFSENGREVKVNKYVCPECGEVITPREAPPNNSGGVATRGWGN